MTRTLAALDTLSDPPPLGQQERAIMATVLTVLRTLYLRHCFWTNTPFPSLAYFYCDICSIFLL